MNSPLGRLAPVDLRVSWVDEARDFTPWLAKDENLALLGETIDLELELEGVEVRVNSFKADILAKDAGTGDYVLIENQLEKTNHDHLGKLITYASGLGATTIVWIARQITQEHRRAIDWLNEVTTDAVGFFGLEVELWRIGDSPPAPKFNLVSQPNEWAKVVSGRTQRQEPTGAKLVQLDFWEGFAEFCRAGAFSLNLRKPRPQHWYPMAIGRRGFIISLTVSTVKTRVGCELYIRKSDPAFSLLAAQKDKIEAELGPLEWQELATKRASRIVQYRRAHALDDRETWPELFAWLRERAGAFYRVFGPRVRALDLDEVDHDLDDE